jgi:hypothetical protein
VYKLFSLRWLSKVVKMNDTLVLAFALIRRYSEFVYSPRKGTTSMSTLLHLGWARMKSKASSVWSIKARYPSRSYSKLKVQEVADY